MAKPIVLSRKTIYCLSKKEREMVKKVEAEGGVPTAQEIEKAEKEKKDAQNIKDVKEAQRIVDLKEEEEREAAAKALNKGTSKKKEQVLAEFMKMQVDADPRQLKVFVEKYKDLLGNVTFGVMKGRQRFVDEIMAALGFNGPKGDITN